jgi:hypothetical protein
VKACRDCVHVKVVGDVEGISYIATCLHPEVSERLADYFTGGERLVHLSVEVARTIGKCKPEGLFWEKADRPA